MSKEKKYCKVIMTISLITSVFLLVFPMIAGRRLLPNNLLIIAVIMIEQIAAYQDINDKMVSDILHYIVFIIITVFLITSVFIIWPGTRFIGPDDFSYLIPPIFCLITSGLRGRSDNMFMICISLIGFAVGIGSFDILLIFAVAYLYGSIIRLVQVVRKQKDSLSFIPALLLGFETVFALDISSLAGCIAILGISFIYSLFAGTIEKEETISIMQTE